MCVAVEVEDEEANREDRKSNRDGGGGGGGGGGEPSIPKFFKIDRLPKMMSGGQEIQKGRLSRKPNQKDLSLE